MKKLNTHFYDGLLTQRFIEVKRWIVQQRVKLDSFNVCIDEIKKLLDNCICNRKIITKANSIIELFIKDSNGNNDTKNHIKVEEILPIVWWNVKTNFDDSGKSLFIEQISEINNGRCPQGRVARLCQFLP